MGKDNSNPGNPASLPESPQSGAIDPGRAMNVSWPFLIGAMAAALAFGLLLERTARLNLIFALALAAAGLVIILGTDLRRGWILLFIASSISVIRVDAGGATIRPDELVLVWLVIVWLGAFVTGKTKFHHLPLALPIVGTLAVNLLSTVVNSPPDKSFSLRSCGLLAIYLTMYLITVNILSENPRLLRKTPFLLLLLGLGQAIYSVIAIGFYASGMKLAGAYRAAAGIGVTASGGFQEANLLGAFEAAIALLLLAHLTLQTRWHKGIRLSLALGLVLAVLTMTFTRAAWMGFALAAFCMVVVLRPPRNILNARSLAILVALGAVFFLIIVPVGNTISGSTGGSGTGISDRLDKLLNFSEGSGLGRVEAQSSAIERWKKNPVLGTGTFSLPPEEAGQSKSGWIYSSIIQSLHDTGIVGAAMLLWIYIGALVAGARGYMKCHSRFWRANFAGVTLGWLALIITSQASSFLWLSFPWIYLGILMSWAENVDIIEEEEDASYYPALDVT